MYVCITLCPVALVLGELMFYSGPGITIGGGDLRVPHGSEVREEHF